MDTKSFVSNFQEELSWSKKEAELNGILFSIERKYRQQFGESKSLRPLWLQMLASSVEWKNIELAKILINKLPLPQLSSCLELLSTSTTTCDDQSALTYIASFLKLQDSSDKLSKSNSRYFNHGKVNQSLEVLERSVLNFQQALLQELEEDFSGALSNHESSSTHLQHAVRLILKNDLSSSYPKIRQYLYKCSDSKSLLAKFAILCGDHVTALDCYEANNDIVSKTYLISNQSDLDLTGQSILHKSFTSPEAFDLNEHNSLSDIKQKINSLFILGSSLTTNVRTYLFRVASLYHNRGDITKACGLYLCSGLHHMVMRLYRKHGRNRKLSKHLWIHLCSPTRAVYSLTSDLERQVQLDHHDEADNKPLLYLKLGLIDEFLQALATKTFRDYSYYTMQAIDTMETIVQKKNPHSLASIDPRLAGSTLDKLHSIVIDDSDLNSFVITIVILCSTIYLLKLNQKLSDENLSDIENLEMLFKSISQFIADLQFNATQSLIRATNFLTLSLKLRLEMISDSETIRQGFKQLIDLVAKKCMVESQYKNAAMLYSSIDNNVDAVKSLMRTGDTDIVINFSLLVKDIAVNRLTINYLKHCESDNAVIEEFISKMNT